MTSMAQARAQYMTGGMTSANVLAANTAVGNYFHRTARSGNQIRGEQDVR